MAATLAMMQLQRVVEPKTERRRRRRQCPARSSSELGPAAVLGSFIAQLVAPTPPSHLPASGARHRSSSDNLHRTKCDHVIGEPARHSKAEFMWYGPAAKSQQQQQFRHQKNQVTTELERILKERQQTLNSQQNNHQKNKKKKSRRLYHSADRIDQLLVNKEVDQRILDNYRAPTAASSESHLNNEPVGGLYSMWFKWFKRNNSRGRNREPPDIADPCSAAHLHNPHLANQQHDVPPAPPQRTSSQHHQPAPPPPGIYRSASTASPLIAARRPSKQSGRSQSAENSPILPVRRRNERMPSAESNDSLSTHSFAFIRASPVANGHIPAQDQPSSQTNGVSERPEITLRRKYGLIFGSDPQVDRSDALPSSTIANNDVEGEAVRAMRTQWESQMRQQSEQRVSFTGHSGRKKRQAPPPPAPAQHQPTRASVSSVQAHVPGKRKAPSPPDSNAKKENKLNIPPKPYNPFDSDEDDEPSPTNNLPSTNEPPQPSSVEASQQPTSSQPTTVEPSQQPTSSQPTGVEPLLSYSDLDQAIALPIPEESKVDTTPKDNPLAEKLLNDFNENLDDRSTKVLNKVIECPHNDTLKLEDGLLRPIQEPAPRSPSSINTTVSVSSQSSHGSQKMSQERRRTIDESTSPTLQSAVNQAGRMTLPLRPWYKRSNQLPSPGSSQQNKEARMKWKDAALIPSAPPTEDNCSWILDAYRRPYLYVHQQGAPLALATGGGTSLSSPESTLSIRVASPALSTDNSLLAPPMSPGGSSNKSSSSTDSSTGGKRKSLLVNISQLDKEAAEIIQKERERESQRRKKMEDEKFYSDVVPPLPSTAPPAEDSDDKVKGAKELIDMFNAMNTTTVTVNSAALENEPKDNGNKEGQVTLVKTNSITRLRVNNETIDDPKPPPSGSTTFERTVFQPKLTTDYPGGARPKRTPSSLGQCSNSPEQKTDGKEEAKGWTCSVCTLINSEARLWCEVCTALRPRKSLNYSSPLTARLNGVAHQEAPTAPPSEKIEKKEVKLERNSSKYWEEEIKKYFVTDACNKTEKEVKEKVVTANEQVTVEEKPKVPTSPEALRQARLAFFSNTASQSFEMPSTSPTPRPDSPTVGDLVQRPKRLLKVSSGVQTPDPSILKSDIETSNDKVKAKTSIPSVQPTQFVLPSPSRTQLSQYIQQRDQLAKARSAADVTQPGTVDRLTVKASSTGPSPSPDEEEKRIKTLLKGLEEAITCGQFDKAAILAKELAATKQRQTGLKFDSSSSSPSPVPQENKDDSSSKPVAAKRTVVPLQTALSAERTSSRNSTSSSFQSPLPIPAERSVSRISNTSGSIYANVNGSVDDAQHPVPVKRQAKPDGQRTLKRAEQPKETLKEEQVTVNESPGSKEAPVPAPRALVRQISMEGEAKPPEPVLPANEQPAEQPKKEVISLSRILDRKEDDNQTLQVAQEKAPTVRQPSLRKKQQQVKRSSTKVDSGQQTNISYRKPVKSTTAESKEEPLPAADDHSFKVRIMIEDRTNNHTAAPFYWSVTKDTTLGELKEKMERERSIPGPHQRWILGRRLANDEKANLQHYEIGPDNSSLYVYVLAEAPRPLVIAPVMKEPVKEAQTQPLAPPAGKYYNFEEDRYSTCEESDDEPPKPDNVIRIQVQHDQVGQQQGAEALESTKEDYKRLLELEQSDLVPNADEMECPICLMAVPSGVGVTLRDCLHCFCKDCLAHVIEFSDEPTISCPYRDDHYQCDSTLQEREIKALVSAELYEKHLAKSMRLAEKRIKNTFHCQTADCTGWAVIEDNINIFRCPVCTRINCLTCQAIHEGVNCKEYQDQLKQNAETDEDAKQTQEMIEGLVASGEALPCPNCQVILMKRWGCDWVRCSVCRTEICWVTKQARWGPKGKGDTSGGCRCGVDGIKCHALCNYCH